MSNSYKICSADNKNSKFKYIYTNNLKLKYIGSPYNNLIRDIPLIEIENNNDTLYSKSINYKTDRQRLESTDGSKMDFQLFSNNEDIISGILDGGNSIDTKYGLFTININIPEDQIPEDENGKLDVWISTWMYDNFPDNRPNQGYLNEDGNFNPASLKWSLLDINNNDDIKWDDIADKNDDMFLEIPNSEKKHYGIINNTIWFKRNSIKNPLYPNEYQWEGYINPIIIFLSYGRNIDEANRNYLYGCSSIIKIQLRLERCLEGWTGYPNCTNQCCRSETFPQCKLNNGDIKNIRDYELREFGESGEEGSEECYIKIGEECSTNNQDGGELIDIDVGDSVKVDVEKIWNYYNYTNEEISNMKGIMKNIIVSNITSTNKYIFNFDNIDCINVKIYDNDGKLIMPGCDIAKIFVSGIPPTNKGLNKPGLTGSLGSSINELIDLNIKLDNIGLDCNGGIGSIIPVKKFDRNSCAKSYCNNLNNMVEYIPEKIEYTCFEDLSENNRYSEVSNAENYCNLAVTAGVDLSLADVSLQQSGAANLIQSYNNCNYDPNIKTGKDDEGGECIERRCPKGKFGKDCDNNCCSGICVWPDKYNNPLLGEYKNYKEWCMDKTLDPIIPPQRCGCKYDPNEVTLDSGSAPNYSINKGDYQICNSSSQCNTLDEQNRVWNDIAVNINNRNWGESEKAKEDVDEWGRMQPFGSTGPNDPQSVADWGCGKAQYIDEDKYNEGELVEKNGVKYLGCEPVWALDTNKCQYYPNSEYTGNGGTSEGYNEDNEIKDGEICSQCLEGWYGPECNMKCCGGLCTKTLDEKSCAEQSLESDELCEYFPELNMCLSTCQGDNREDCVSTRGCRWGVDYSEGYKTSPTGNPEDGNIGPYCLNNECTCENGVPAKGIRCPMHNTESCISCDKGYEKVYGLPPMEDFFTCKEKFGITSLINWYLSLIKWDEIQEDFFSKNNRGPVRIIVFISVVLSSILSVLILMLLIGVSNIGELASYIIPQLLINSGISFVLFVILSFLLYYVPVLFNNYIWSNIPSISIPFTPFSIGGGKKINTAFLLFRSPYFIILPITLLIIVFNIITTIYKLTTI